MKTGTLDVGTYFIAARIKDSSGHVRYAYSPYSIELVSASAPMSRSLFTHPNLIESKPVTRLVDVFRDETDPHQDQLW